MADCLPQSCAAHSAGPVNGIFGILLQTVLASQCGLFPNDRWPRDYGPTALKNGKFKKNKSFNKAEIFFKFSKGWVIMILSLLVPEQPEVFWLADCLRTKTGKFCWLKQEMIHQLRVK